MPRSWIRTFCWAGFVLLSSGIGNLLAQETKGDSHIFADLKIGTVLSETLLPETTEGFFAISNVDTLSEHWDKTQLGHLMADPVMEPFKKDIRRQFEERWSNVHDRLGLTLEDMRGVPGGDVGIGLIAPAPGKAALAIVIDVSGKLPNANEMLKKVTEAQLKRGAKRSEVKVEGCPDAVIKFDLPIPEDEREAGRSTLPGAKTSDEAASEEKSSDEDADKAPSPPEDETRPAFYCLTGNLLVVTDNIEILKGILGRGLGHQKGGSLADHKPFQYVMERCRKDYGDATPQLRWFIHPLGYAEAARAATPENKRRKGKSILEVMQHQGVGAIQGVGGLVDFYSENYELVHRTAVYAPGPYEKSMKMLVLPNQPDFEPQPWAPRDVATYTTFYFDIQNGFKHFGNLFDELFGQGDTDVWEETKRSLKEDPNGPQIDLGPELIEHLGQRVSVLTDYQLPITTSSERLLFAIEVKDDKAIAAAIEKLFVNDPTVKRRDENGHVIWEIVGDESPEPTAPDISFGDVPAVTPVHPLKKKIKKDENGEEEERPPLLPHAAVTVWEGNLFIASHIDFLRKVIAPEKKPEPLSKDVDYTLIDEEIQKFVPKEKCLRLFSRTDEEYRPTYELVRQNKMPESEALFAKLLNALFGEGKKGETRAQKIDGSQLPDYSIVRRYLGPAGLQVTSEPDGWYLKGFTLNKEAE